MSASRTKRDGGKPIANEVVGLLNSFNELSRKDKLQFLNMSSGLVGAHLVFNNDAGASSLRQSNREGDRKAQSGKKSSSRTPKGAAAGQPERPRVKTGRDELKITYANNESTFKKHLKDVFRNGELQDPDSYEPDGTDNKGAPVYKLKEHLDNRIDQGVKLAYQHAHRLYHSSRLKEGESYEPPHPRLPKQKPVSEEKASAKEVKEEEEQGTVSKAAAEADTDGTETAVKKNITNDPVPNKSGGYLKTTKSKRKKSQKQTAKQKL